MLDRYHILAELTTTTRVGMHRYSYPKGATEAMVIDLTHRDEVIDSYLEVVNDSTVRGYRFSKAWASNQKVFFYLQFSKKIKSFLNGNETISPSTNIASGKNVKALFLFDAAGSNPFMVKVAISGVDMDGARKNMLQELNHWNFDAIILQCEQQWNKELNKLQVHGGTEAQKIHFYTALYHCFIHPSTYSDVDGRYMGRDMKIHQADGFTYYTVFSLWDTFRALHPLFNIVQRERNSDFIKTFLTQYQHSGRLPVWELSSNETNCMIGNHAISVIADAWAKGVNDFDINLAYEASRNTLYQNTQYGYTAYYHKGYLEIQDEHESVSKTLEYAYNDWCMMQLSQYKKISEAEEKETKPLQLTLNATQHIDKTLCGNNWKNLFNIENTFIQPRSNGGWLKNFNPKEVNNHYTEANGWQYNFFVPHDVKSLVQLYGGKAAFENKLDEMFGSSTQTVGREQADISGMLGQYAHGNEPSHHMAYLYALLGKQRKTDSIVHKIRSEMYFNAPDGLIGNEDCGQMSAWYVFSAMGFYPFCPGINAYVSVQPIFDTVRILGKEFKYRELNLENDFENNQHTNCHEEVAPVIKSEGLVFIDSAKVQMSNIYGNERPVFYHLVHANGKATQSRRYTLPFYIHQSCSIYAYHQTGEKEEKPNTVTIAYLHKMPNTYTIKINSKYNKQYTAGGDEGLIDGLRGDEEWRKGYWQGYQSQDMEVVIDMRKAKDITRISSGYLQDSRSWILLPKEVLYYTSTNGVDYDFAAKWTHSIGWQTDINFIKNVTCTFAKTKARYVKVIAKNYGPLPQGHQGYGGDAFIFADEITIE
jgi:predicted alpha-1,2-mannosidase